MGTALKGAFEGVWVNKCAGRLKEEEIGMRRIMSES